MARASKNKDVLTELIEMAKQYGVNDNAVFVAALDAEDSLMSTKEYVKGRENIYAHPLVKELPKHADSANRTAQTILNIIETLGKKKKDPGGKLGALMDE